MHNLFLGMAIFSCCGKPHLVMASRDTREVCEANFQATLAKAAKTMGNGEPASQSMLIEIPGWQFMEIEAMFHGIELPEPDVQVFAVNSPAEAIELLKSMGLTPDGPEQNAPGSEGVH